MTIAADGTPSVGAEVTAKGSDYVLQRRLHLKVVTKPVSLEPHQRAA